MDNEKTIFEKLDKHSNELSELRTGHSTLMFRVVHLEKSKDEILLTMAANRAENAKELAMISSKTDTLLAENYKAQGAASAIRWTQTGIQMIVGLAAVFAIVKNIPH